MNPFILIGVFLLLGFFIQWRFHLPDTIPQRLNQIVINIILPIVILINIPKLDISAELLFPAYSCWIIIFISAGLVLALSKIYQWSQDITGALLMVAVLGNTSYIGFPIIQAYYGDIGLANAIIYDQLGNFIALATYGTIICTLYSNQGEAKPSLSALTLKIIRFPPFVSLLLVLSIHTVWPQYLQSALSLFEWPLSLIAYLLIPLTMLIIGLQFRLRIDVKYRQALIWALGIKLMLAPLLLIGIALMSNTDGLIAQVSLVEAGMPAMVSAAALAMSYQLAPQLCASVVSFGIIVCSASSYFWYQVALWLF